MAKIRSIVAREIFDSRGNPTIETSVELSDGAVAKSSVPSGASRGIYEAFEMRDGDLRRYTGMGVVKAVQNVNTLLAPKLLGIDAGEQQKIDNLMIRLDGTSNKARLGANAMLSVSQAVAKVGAKSSLLPLFIHLRGFLPSFSQLPKSSQHAPVQPPREALWKIPIPIFTMIEGKKHASNNLDFQDFYIVPASFKECKESLEMGATIYHTLKELLQEKGLSTSVADEAGFAPSLTTNQEALNLLKQAIEIARYTFSLDVFLGIDAASSSFYKDKSYKLIDRSAPFNQEEFVEFYTNLFSEFSLIYIEDPFSEDDWDGWKRMTTALSTRTLIAGDEVTTTNPQRLQAVLTHNVMNSIVIIPSQIGTVMEAIAVAEIARYKQLKIVVSARSGETMDDFIVDFAVAVGADYVKLGAPAREREVKYDRLLEIKNEIEKI